MNIRWSLNELYTSFDDTKYKNDIERIDQIIDNICEFTENELINYNNPGGKTEEIINNFITYYEKFSLLRIYTFLSLSTDARNEQAAKLLEKLNQKDTRLTKPKVKIQKWLAGLSNLEGLLEERELLNEHKFFIQELIEKSNYLLDETEEVIISKMRNTGSTAWAKLQQDLTSTLLVEVEVDDKKKELPLPIVRNMAYKKDPEIRKIAYHAELSAYEKIEESIAASLNGIKGEVITTAKLRGYKSPLEKTLQDSRMEGKTLDTMFKAIKECLPVFRKYYRHKAKLLDHKNGLPFYDIFAPVAEVDMDFTYPEARDFIVANFSSFSDNLANYAANAFEKRWIDAEPREGKRGGAFCSNIHPIGESRILVNFTGTYNDVSTLAHELGHGYHGHCLKDESILNSDYPMPLAETASILCQTIVDLAAIEQSEPDNALAILENSISDAGQVIVDIYSRFLFESKLFEKREESSLSVKELKETMLWAQKESYGDALDENILHPYMWLCKPHYYEASLNFYNFPYAFGLLFAKGLYARYQKEGSSFVEEYDNILKMTGKLKIVDICNKADIDINDINFWNESLAIIESDIDKFIKLSS